MSNKNTFKCPNCPRQFLSQRSLRLHLPSCRKSHLLTANAHSQIEYHPLRSLRHFDDQDLEGCSQCVDADIDDDDSEMDNVFTAESFVCWWQDNFTKFTLLFFLLLLGTANSPSTNRISNSVWWVRHSGTLSASRTVRFLVRINMEPGFRRTTIVRGRERS